MRSIRAALAVSRLCHIPNQALPGAGGAVDITRWCAAIAARGAAAHAPFGSSAPALPGNTWPAGYQPPLLSAPGAPRALSSSSPPPVPRGGAGGGGGGAPGDALQELETALPPSNQGPWKKAKDEQTGGRWAAAPARAQGTRSPAPPPRPRRQKRAAVSLSLLGCRSSEARSAERGPVLRPKRPAPRAAGAPPRAGCARPGRAGAPAALRMRAASRHRARRAGAKTPAREPPPPIAAIGGTPPQKRRRPSVRPSQTRGWRSRRRAAAFTIGTSNQVTTRFIAAALGAPWVWKGAAYRHTYGKGGIGQIARSRFVGPGSGGSRRLGAAWGQLLCLEWAACARRRAPRARCEPAALALINRRSSDPFA